jgi:hypothetical protein
MSFESLRLYSGGWRSKAGRSAGKWSSATWWPHGVPDLAGGDGGQGVVAGLVDQFAACGAVNGDLFKVPAGDELAQGAVTRGCHRCCLLPVRSRVIDGLV